MREKHERFALSLILDNLNKGRKIITTKELGSIEQDDEAGLFEKSAVPGVLKRLEGKKIIRKSGEDTYSIIVDIATLREMILGSDESGTNEGRIPKYTMELNDLLASEWVAVNKTHENDELQTLFWKLGLDDPKNRSDDTDDGDADEDDDDDDDDDFAKRRAYLEARRREILKSMQENAENGNADGNGDDAAEPSDDSPAGRRSAGKRIPPEIYAIAQTLDDGVSVVESDGEYYLIPNGLEIGGTAIRFRIQVRDDGVYLSDDGLALLSLEKRVSFDDEGVDEQIGFIADRYGIGVAGDALRIKVGSPESAISRMMQLFAAMERIVTIDGENIAVCVEYGKEDDKIWDTVRELLTAEPNMDRNTLILRMRERYQSVKDGESIDNIIVCARGVKEFLRMSDEDYLKIRDLIGKGNEQPAAEPKEEGPAAEITDGEEPDGEATWSKEMASTAEIITAVLADFRIDATVVCISVGAAVARVELVVPPDVPASSVIKRETEVAMRLGQRNGVRMYADPSSGRICVEVPRAASEREKVSAGKMVHNTNGRWQKQGALFFAIGKNIDKEPVYGDLARMKNILIAGECCTGKSTLLHTMIYTFISKYSPEDVRLILCDCKTTEFARYKEIPHLITDEIVTEPQQMILALRWLDREIARRYQLFDGKTAAGVPARNINEYNAARKEGEEKLPRIVFIVDEFTDFSIATEHELDDTVQHLAHKGWGAGIHFVLAAQRPFVFSGWSQEDFPARIAFHLPQETNSRMLLGEGGAQELLMLGDMLMKFNSRCERIQAAYIPPVMLEAAASAAQEHFERIHGRAAAEGASHPEEHSAGPLYIKALAVVIQAGEASISLVQRKCCIGYNHAGKVIEWMESMGYISPFDEKTKKRKVLMTKEQFLEKYGPLD